MTYRSWLDIRREEIGGNRLKGNNILVLLSPHQLNNAHLLKGNGYCHDDGGGEEVEEEEEEGGDNDNDDDENDNANMYYMLSSTEMSETSFCSTHSSILVTLHNNT
jgi:hypothetical protein